MKKVFTLSVLLLIGLILSQIIPLLCTHYLLLSHVVKIATMICLSFIMIHVGYEFDLEKNNARQYGFDYFVAFTSATFPWIFVTLYFVYVLSPGNGPSWDIWKDSLLAARFAAPTSAGVLFSMLAAAGLATTWMFNKTRILTIFDDLDTVLLMIPLQMLIIGFRIQLVFVVVVMLVLIWLAWKYLHVLRLSIRWNHVLLYAIGITGLAEIIYFSSKLIDEVVPVHIEVLLPAFVLGTMISKRHNVTRTSAGEEDILELHGEKKISFIISAIFMVLVGLSMPVLDGLTADFMKTNKIDEEITKSYVIGAENPDMFGLEPRHPWKILLLHVLAITLISNLGKMFPAFVYRKEAHWKQRLAIAVSMFPRGEVGAGVLIISLSYGISGTIISVAMLSLALNLLLTGLFILIARKLMVEEIGVRS